MKRGVKGAIAYSRIAPNGYTCGGIRRSTAYSALAQFTRQATTGRLATLRFASAGLGLPCLPASLAHD